TPYEAVTGTPPNLSGVPVWGAQLWVHSTAAGKIGDRAVAARWVGFDGQSKGHRVYWPERRSVTVERNVRFAAPNLPAPFVDDDAVELEGEDVVDDDKSVTSEPEPPKDEPTAVRPAGPVTNLPPVAVPESGRPTRNRMPSRVVRDILEGRGADEVLPRGVRV
ncbi:hypothetical protein C8Q78DRAFT_939085, partial [Trametes maxima]